MKSFRIKYNANLCIEGGILTLLGILGPFFVNEQMMEIYQTLEACMLKESGSLLVIAAIKLVFMNTVRMVPHYLGAFLINESIRIYIREKRHFIPNIMFTVAIIMLIYEMIYRIYGIQYDLGIPAILTIAFVLLLSYWDLFSVQIVNKSILVGSLLVSIQWLDVVPYLTAYKFGRGEISMDIKSASYFIQEDVLLSVFAIALSAAFFFASMIQVKLLIKEHKLKTSNEKQQRIEKELYDTKLKALQMRNASELQNLVHDLKSPLTTAQGLLSLIEMMEKDKQLKEYVSKISDSLSTLNLMISEILYEDKRMKITTVELMRSVLAEISIIFSEGQLEYKNMCPNAYLKGNIIRLSRAIINVLMNGYDAIDKKNGKLKLTVDCDDTMIYITIWDNGVGMDADELEQIWNLGYSGKESTGLGLPFVKQVVEKHEGTIQVRSEKGSYTSVMICLRKEYAEDENVENNLGDR